MKLGARHPQEREESYEASLADMKEKKQRLSTLKIEAAQLEKDFKVCAKDPFLRVPGVAPLGCRS